MITVNDHVISLLSICPFISKGSIKLSRSSFLMLPFLLLLFVVVIVGAVASIVVVVKRRALADANFFAWMQLLHTVAHRLASKLHLVRSHWFPLFAIYLLAKWFPSQSKRNKLLFQVPEDMKSCSCGHVFTQPKSINGKRFTGNRESKFVKIWMWV